MREFFISILKSLIQTFFKRAQKPEAIKPPEDTPKTNLEVSHPREWIEKIESELPKKKEDRF
jgi:hypothetical protein